MTYQTAFFLDKNKINRYIIFRKNDLELDNGNIILLTGDTHYSITRMTARVTGVRLLEASGVACQNS